MTVNVVMIGALIKQVYYTQIYFLGNEALEIRS